MSIDGQMDEQNVVCTYHGIPIFTLKKEGDSATCYNMNEPWGHHAKWNKAVTKKTSTVWFHYMR